MGMASPLPIGSKSGTGKAKARPSSSIVLFMTLNAIFMKNEINAQGGTMQWFFIELINFKGTGIRWQGFEFYN